MVRAMRPANQQILDKLAGGEQAMWRKLLDCSLCPHQTSQARYLHNSHPTVVKRSAELQSIIEHRVTVPLQAKERIQILWITFCTNKGNCTVAFRANCKNELLQQPYALWCDSLFKSRAELAFVGSTTHRNHSRQQPLLETFEWAVSPKTRTTCDFCISDGVVSLQTVVGRVCWGNKEVHSMWWDIVD
eukprot:TRINITY_DN58975_c0_g1_i1.p1 TRINITY_DN58975_c0_g1~~TRINITY_DN58975_c0_g1_i1.p1  ORF type:complete len:188 (-),score=11.31 TRINITY_DN58975_c0_g1_i1:355-918(-)